MVLELSPEIYMSSYNRREGADCSPSEDYGLHSCVLPERYARHFPQLDAISSIGIGDCFDKCFVGRPETIVADRKAFSERIRLRRLAPRKPTAR